MRVAQDAQQVAQVVVAAQPAGPCEHARAGVLDKVLGLVAVAAERPRGAEQPIEVIDTQPPECLSRQPQAGPVGPVEPLRLVFSFNDIFVSIGLIALVVGAVLLSGAMFEMPATGRGTQGPVLDWRLLVAPLVAIWGAGEFFVRHRRMALPAIVLGLFFMLLSWFGAIVFVERVWLPLNGFAGIGALPGGDSSWTGGLPMSQPFVGRHAATASRIGWYRVLRRSLVQSSVRDRKDSVVMPRPCSSSRNRKRFHCRMASL